MTTGPQKVCVRVKHMRGLGGSAVTSQGHSSVKQSNIGGRNDLVESATCDSMGLHFWLLFCSSEYIIP